MKARLFFIVACFLFKSLAGAIQAPDLLDKEITFIFRYAQNSGFFADERIKTKLLDQSRRKRQEHKQIGQFLAQILMDKYTIYRCLLLCYQAGLTEAAWFLINEANVDLRQKNSHKQNILHLAVMSQDIAHMQKLFQKLRLKDSMLLHALQNEFDDCGDLPIQKADREVVNNALIAACSKGLTDVVFFLIDELVADLLRKDEFDQNILHLAVMSKNLDFTAKLYQKLKTEYPNQLNTLVRERDLFGELPIQKTCNLALYEVFEVYTEAAFSS